MHEAMRAGANVNDWQQHGHDGTADHSMARPYIGFNLSGGLGEGK